MKLVHRRSFEGVLFESVTHYGHKDPKARALAKAVRDTTGAKARVVHDKSGFTHVFVERNHPRYDDAFNMAAGPEFQ